MKLCRTSFLMVYGALFSRSPKDHLLWGNMMALTHSLLLSKTKYNTWQHKCDSIKTHTISIRSKDSANGALPVNCWSGWLSSDHSCSWKQNIPPPIFNSLVVPSLNWKKKKILQRDPNNLCMRNTLLSFSKSYVDAQSLCSSHPLIGYD